MRLLFYVVALFLLIASTASCSKQDCRTSDPSDTPEKKGLPGTWKWVRTDGGIANHIHETPASTGKNIELQIKPDFTYAVYTNGTVTSQGTYILDTRNCIHDHTSKQVINFSSLNDQDMMIEKLDGINLELSDEAYDGTGSLYTRK